MRVSTRRRTRVVHAAKSAGARPGERKRRGLSCTRHRAPKRRTTRPMSSISATGCTGRTSPPSTGASWWPRMCNSPSTASWPKRQSAPLYARARGPGGGGGPLYRQVRPERALRLAARRAGPDLVDAVQLVQRYLKDVGIEAELKLQEYGSFIATTGNGKFEGLAMGPGIPRAGSRIASCRLVCAGHAAQHRPRQ
jgi:hypothetical protein